jgi:hypothetical protein
MRFVKMIPKKFIAFRMSFWTAWDQPLLFIQVKKEHTLHIEFLKLIDLLNQEIHASFIAQTSQQDITKGTGRS